MNFYDNDYFLFLCHRTKDLAIPLRMNRQRNNAWLYYWLKRKEDYQWRESSHRLIVRSFYSIYLLDSISIGFSHDSSGGWSPGKVALQCRIGLQVRLLNLRSLRPFFRFGCQCIQQVLEMHGNYVFRIRILVIFQIFHRYIYRARPCLKDSTPGCRLGSTFIGITTGNFLTLER